MTTGAMILGLRTAARLSQAELARRVGIDHAFLSRVEAGKRRTSLKLLAGVADAFGLDPRQRLRLLLIRAEEEGYVVGGGL